MMLRGNSLRLTLLSLAAIVLFGACRKREGFALPDNYVVFTSDAQGIDESENSITVTVKLSRGTDKEIPLVINLTEEGATYGVKYTTVPEAVSGVLNLTIPSGNNEASFTVNKVPGALFDGTEKLVFDLYSSGSPILIGVTKKLTLSFAELVATNSSYTINGGGVTFPNKVFIDLSANRETPVLRTNWDLGFYTDPNDFKVILNSSTAMMAKQINKNDLTQVTAADTTGLLSELSLSSFAFDPAQMAYVDHYSGDLTKTAIGAVSATASDNKVFIINRGTGVGTPAPARGWKKIRILRNASGGYTLQYADIASPTFSSIDIPKDDKYFFKYVSFDNGIVAVEPEKKKWDIAWSYFTYVFVNAGVESPFMYQDMILQNRNVEVAKVMMATKSYDSFNEADIAAQTFSSIQTAIGPDWRSTYPTVSVKADQYYIIKDGDGNYYKLRFTAITDNGVRGYPAIEYVLIKRA